VTTKHFLSVFGLETLRELPDLERMEDAGLLSRQMPVREEFAEGSGGDEQD
jgi:chromosome segregation and condensation protein ScpB